MKLLNVIDEFTRECPAILVERGIDADGIVAVRDRLMLERGVPGFVRLDNGPEFIAHAVAGWCRFNTSGHRVHRPRRAMAERLASSHLTGGFSDKLLNLWRFDSLREAQVIIEDWRIDDTTNRPHTAHGDQTPAEFAAAWTTINELEVA